MKTSLIFICVVLTAQLFGQSIERQQYLSISSKNRGGNVVYPLTDPINFFITEMVGSCIQVQNVQINFTGDKTKSSSQIGMWIDSTNQIGIEYGMIISTGNVFDAIDSATFFASTNINGPGDSLLTNLVGYPTYDAVNIEFDFVPLSDSIIPFEFVFASEEYPEWVDSKYNDVFGFYIQGPGYNSLTNVAIVPGTTLPIAINSVNSGLNSQFYIDNTYGTFLAYDAYTTVFSLLVPVIANQLYHFKLVLADVSDQIFDSAIILKAGTFTSNVSVPAPSFTYTVNGNSVSFTNTSQHGLSYYWDFGDGTYSTETNPVHVYDVPGIYQVTLKAFNQCYMNEIVLTVDMLNSSLSDNLCALSSLAMISDGVYELKGVALDAMANVYSIAGYKVNANIQQKGNGLLIDLSALPKGLYILKVNQTAIKLVR